MKRVRIGAGAGFADDRIDPAVEVAERGNLDYLVFECLAERTIALAQLDKRRDPNSGFNEWLEDRMEAVLPAAVERGTKIITNMGAANPAAAAVLVSDIAARHGFRLTVAAVTGDDVLTHVTGTDLPLLERQATVASLGDRIVSANAYLGIEPLLDALEAGADVVIAGRIADPALFLAPLVHEFGWARDDWATLGTGTAVGHLLECAGHVTGGYFADPGVKDVPDLARLGFPIADVAEDGSFVVTKVAGSGGCVTVATVAEQLLYEVHDPARYITPDVVADFSRAQLRQVGEDRVEVSGIGGAPRPPKLKVSVGYVDSYVGTGEISYTGPNAVPRARLALDVVRQRLELLDIPLVEVRYDLIGVDAVHRGAGSSATGMPGEVRIRVAGRTTDLKHARRIGREVTALWLNGPSGGGGATRTAVEDIAIVSVLLPRDAIRTTTSLISAQEPA
jgi:Acyclic terpene utilisation family protein AtuA